MQAHQLPGLEHRRPGKVARLTSKHYRPVRRMAGGAPQFAYFTHFPRGFSFRQTLVGGGGALTPTR